MLIKVGSTTGFTIVCNIPVLTAGVPAWTVPLYLDVCVNGGAPVGAASSAASTGAYGAGGPYVAAITLNAADVAAVGVREFIVKDTDNNVIGQRTVNVVADLPGGDVANVTGDVEGKVLGGGGSSIIALGVQADVEQIAGNATAAQRLSLFPGATNAYAVDTATFAPTTTEFETSDTNDYDLFTNQLLYWTAGVNAGIFSRVAAYEYTGNAKVKLTLADALPTAPTSMTTFMIVGRAAPAAQPGDEMDIVNTPNGLAAAALGDAACNRMFFYMTGQVFSGSPADSIVSLIANNATAVAVPNPVELTAAYDAAKTAAQAGDAMNLTPDALDAILVEAGIAPTAALVNDSGTQLTAINARQALAAILAVLAGQQTFADPDCTDDPAGLPGDPARVESTLSSTDRTITKIRVPD